MKMWLIGVSVACLLNLATAFAVDLDDDPVSSKSPDSKAPKPKPKLKPFLIAGSSYRDCADCPEMVVLPGGSFMMGSISSPKDDFADEMPRNSLSVRSFALGKYEVSKQQFAVFVTSTGYHPGDDCTVSKNDRRGNWLNPAYSQTSNDPVVCVSVTDTKAYTQWLNHKTGKRYRLPTEAEWEYAARADTTTERFWGDSPDPACQYANVADLTLQQHGYAGTIQDCMDGHVYTAPIGSYRANGFGLYDMLGNVWEWTCSAYTKAYDGSERICANNPINGVIRGGSWLTEPLYTRSAVRMGTPSTVRDASTGFRLAQDL